MNLKDYQSKHADLDIGSFTAALLNEPHAAGQMRQGELAARSVDLLSLMFGLGVFSFRILFPFCSRS